VEFSEGDLIVAIGSTLSKDGIVERHKNLATVKAVGKKDLFLQSEKNGKVFKISQERCARVDYQSTASLGETLSPKLGDLVVSVTERFGNIEKKMGVLVEITDEPGKYVLAKILKGETSSIVAFDSLIVME